MSNPFYGEIRMFAGNFAPQGNAFCDGQLLAISQNDALFSLLGTTYGGDGRTTFALPDLRGRIPIHAGTGPGLSARPLGQKSGSEQVALTAAQLPTHTHVVQGTNAGAGATNPAGNVFATAASFSYTNESGNGLNQPVGTTAAGGGQPHTNLMPTLCVNFIIALFGIYPSRT